MLPAEGLATSTRIASSGYVTASRNVAIAWTDELPGIQKTGQFISADPLPPPSLYGA